MLLLIILFSLILPLFPRFWLIFGRFIDVLMLFSKSLSSSLEPFCNCVIFGNLFTGLSLRPLRRWERLSSSFSVFSFYTSWFDKLSCIVMRLSNSLKSWKNGSLSACSAVNRSSGSYASNFAINSTHSSDTWFIKFLIPVPTLFGKLKSICDACTLNLFNTC